MKAYSIFLLALVLASSFANPVRLNDVDEDGDGLPDAVEERLGTKLGDAYDPGIYCLYNYNMMTRDYFCWENVGGIDIAFASIVIRRGTDFRIGGPSTATMTIVKSIDELTSLTPTRVAGGWQISIGTSSTVGKYSIILTDGTWSKSMDLYVIFELPMTSTGNDRDVLTSAGLKAYVYDEDSIKDDVSVIWFGSTYGSSATDAWDGSYWHSVLCAGKFDNAQYTSTVFASHVMPSINGKLTQWDAAQAILNHTYSIKNFGCPDPYFDMVSWLSSKSIYNCSDSECSGFAGALTSFLRSAGIPARPVLHDGHGGGGNWDHATEAWLSDTREPGLQWYALHGYTNRTAKRLNFYSHPKLMVTAGPNFDITHLDKAKGVLAIPDQADHPHVGWQMWWLTKDESGGEWSNGYWDYHHRYANSEDQGVIGRQPWVITENVPYFNIAEPPLWGGAPWDGKEHDGTPSDLNRPAEDFSISIWPSTKTIVQGEDAFYPINVTSSTGYRSLPIVMELSGFDACYAFQSFSTVLSTDSTSDGSSYVTHYCSNNRVIPDLWGWSWWVGCPGDATVPGFGFGLRVKTTSQTTTGNYTLTIKATGKDGKSHSQIVVLSVIPSPLNHDISIANVKVAKTAINDSITESQWRGDNYVTVFVKNEGDANETNLVVKAYYNATLIGTKIVASLPFNSTKPVPFKWNTTTLAKGAYAMNATVDTVTGETDTADNFLNNVTVNVVILGDINPDGAVNILDITTAAVAYSSRPPQSDTGAEVDINRDGTVDDADSSIVEWAFGSSSGDANWNMGADVNNDGRINQVDVALVAGALGKTSPKWNLNADLNDDWVVNILDISAVARYFNTVDP